MELEKRLRRGDTPELLHSYSKRSIMVRFICMYIYRVWGGQHPKEH